MKNPNPKLQAPGKSLGPNRRRDGDLRGLKARGGAGVTVSGVKPVLLERIKVDQTGSNQNPNRKAQTGGETAKWGVGETGT